MRVFDWETRRIFRKICEPAGGKAEAVFDVRFVEDFGNVLVVVRLGGCVEWFRYEGGVAIGVGKIKLELRRVFCVEAVLGNTGIMLVGGMTEGNRAVLLALDLRKLVVAKVVWSGEDSIYSIALRRELGGKQKWFLMAMNQGARGQLRLLKSTDGIQWFCVTSSGSRVEATEVEHTKSTQGSSRYRCSAVWCGQGRLVISEVDGTFIVSQFEESHEMLKVSCDQSAHVRQVFAMKSLAGTNGRAFASISMDRTLATWQFELVEGEWRLCLKFRSLRTSGPVRSIALSQNQPRVEEAKGTSKERRSFFTYCSGDTVTCFALGADGRRCEMKGELAPFGPSNSKQKRGRLSCLGSVIPSTESFQSDFKHSHETTVFGGLDGRLGLIRIMDGRLEYIISKKRKRHLGDVDLSLIEILLPGHDRAVSIANNGEIVEWTLPGCEQLHGTGQAKSITPRNSYNVHELRGKGSDIQAVRLVPFRNEDGVAILFGNSNGSVSMYSVRGEVLMNEVNTSLSRIGCMAHQKCHGLVAVADSHGSIATFNIPLLNANWNSIPIKPMHIENLQKEDCLREALSHLAWAPICKSEHTNESCDCSKQSKYLAAITTKGESLVFVLDTECRLILRTRLKGHSGKVHSLVWESGHTLFTGGEDGSVRHWDVSRQPWPHTNK